MNLTTMGAYRPENYGPKHQDEADIRAGQFLRFARLPSCGAYGIARQYAPIPLNTRVYGYFIYPTICGIRKLCVGGNLRTALSRPTASTSNRNQLPAV
jgi:hypothetical protein